MALVIEQELAGGFIFAARHRRKVFKARSQNRSPYLQRRLSRTQSNQLEQGLLLCPALQLPKPQSKEQTKCREQNNNGQRSQQ